MLILRPIKKFQQLPAKQKIIFFQGIYYYLIYQAIFRWLPNKIMIAYLQRKKSPKVRADHCYDDYKNIYEILAWRLQGMKACLCRSFVAYALYSNCFSEVHFHYGIDLEANNFEAHSWVENDTGEVLSDCVSLKDKFKTIWQF